MVWRGGVAAIVMLGLGGAAFAQTPPHNAEKFAEVFAKLEDIFGGREAFQAAFEQARAEQARVEGALQLAQNLEQQFRAKGSSEPADLYLKAANALLETSDHLRGVFGKFDALDTPLDEARAQAAYDAVAAEYAALFQKPMTEQYEYSRTHPLTEEPLKSLQIAAETLIAIAARPPR